MLQRIENLKKELENLVAATQEQVEELRIKYLSKKGQISALMADFRNVPADQKKEVGQKVNELKTLAQEKITALKESFAEQGDKEIESIDLTRTESPVACRPQERTGFFVVNCGQLFRGSERFSGYGVPILAAAHSHQASGFCQQLRRQRLRSPSAMPPRTPGG